MRLIGYVRVSTSQQADSGASIDAQTTKITAMATVKGYPLLDILTDAGESAKDLERPGMQRILQMVHNREIDGVLIAKLDRMTRSVKDLAHLMEQFESHNVSLISVEESLDTGSAAGRLVLNIMVAVSQWEREAIGERTSSALQQIKASGCPAGPAPYGYRAQPRPVVNGVRQRMPLVPDMAEQHTIRVILDLHQRGDSYREIAAQLNAAGYRSREGGNWSHAAVGVVIKRNVVVGEVAA